MHHASFSADVRSAKIDLMLGPFYVDLPVLCPPPFICEKWLVDIHGAVFEHVVIVERPERHCCQKLISNVTVQYSFPKFTVDWSQNTGLEYEYGSNEQPVGSLHGPRRDWT